MKCPTCNRMIRVKKPKAETLEDAHKRIILKTRAGIAAAIRKPMPTKTSYKE